MPGGLTISLSGEVFGWAPTRRWPSNGWVDVRVDGRHIARVRAERVGRGAVDGWAKFALQLPAAYMDGRLHEVRARLAWGKELTGSPAPFEAPRHDAPPGAFVLRPATEGQAQASVGFLAAEGRCAILFDRKPADVGFEAPAGSLVQNRADIGGLPEHRSYRPWPSYVAAFRDHYVDPGYGGVYRPDGGAVWQGSTYLFNTLAQERACLQVLAGVTAPPPARRCILFCNSVRDTYFHWHLDCLAGLLMARERLGPEPRAIGPRLNSWQKASLALLGEDVVELDAACRPEEVFVASHIDGRGIHPDHAVLDLFARLKAAHIAQGRNGSPIGCGERVFVSRRDAGHRVLANEDELWAALKPKGFVRFTPGEASYGEQIDVFSTAEIIVASHGSALTNTGFCRPDTLIVEILPSDYLNGCFRYLAIAAGLRHAWYATDRVSPFEVEVGSFMDWCAAQALF